MAKRSSVELDDRQRQAARLLVSGVTRSEVCRRLSMSRNTIDRWLTNQVFRNELQALRSECYSSAVEELRGLAAECVRAVKSELNRGDNAAAVALKVLQMIGVEKLLHESLPKQQAVDVDADRIAGRGRATLIDREMERLQAERQRLIETTATVVND